MLSPTGPGTEQRYQFSSLHIQHCTEGPVREAKPTDQKRDAETSLLADNTVCQFTNHRTCYDVNS